MRFSLLTIGKPKFRFWVEAEAHYLEVISHNAEITIQELKEQDADVEREAKLFLATWSKRRGDARLVVLDEKGKNFESREFTHRLVNWFDQGVREVVFVIGGAYGLSSLIKDEADLVLSLSKMTLPHDLARVVLLEQLYRATQIKKNSRYHHD